MKRRLKLSIIFIAAYFIFIMPFLVFNALKVDASVSVKCGNSISLSTNSLKPTRSNSECVLNIESSNYEELKELLIENDKGLSYSFDLTHSVPAKFTLSGYYSGRVATISVEGFWKVSVKYINSSNSTISSSYYLHSYSISNNGSSVLREDSESGNVISIGNSFFKTQKKNVYFENTVYFSYDCQGSMDGVVFYYDVNNTTLYSGPEYYDLVLYDKYGIGNAYRVYVYTNDNPPLIYCNGHNVSSNYNYPTIIKDSCSLLFSSDTYLSSYSITNNSVSISGNTYNYGTLSNEGLYQVTVKNISDKEIVGYILIDKTAPTIKCGNKILSSTITYSKTSCSLVIEDNIEEGILTYAISGDLISSGNIYRRSSYTYGTLSNEGEYNITVTDNAGNSTTGSLIIDYTVPEMKEVTSGSILSIDGTNYFSGSSLTFEFSDLTSGFLKANHDYVGAPYEAIYDTTSTSMTLYSGCEYVIAVYDKAGNSASYRIVFDNTAPIWYTRNVSSVNAGSTITVELTDSGSGIYDYLTAASYYKYGWSTSATTFTGTYITNFSSNTSSLVSFTIATPVPSVSTTYYLWVYNTGQDMVENVATYSGKKPYSIGTSASSYLKYSYVVSPDVTETKVTCGNTILSNDSEAPVYINYYCSLYLFNPNGIFEYYIDNEGMTTLSGSPTSYKHTTTLSEGSYEIVLYGTGNDITMWYVVVDKTLPVIRENSTSGTALTSNFYYFPVSSKTLYFTDTLSDFSYASCLINGETFVITDNSYTFTMIDSDILLSVYDKAGNSKSIEFYLLPSKPVISCNGQEIINYDMEHYVSSCYLSFSISTSSPRYYLSKYQITSAEAGDTNIVNLTNEPTAFDHGTLEEASYEIIVYDGLGNETILYLYIDPNKPIWKTDNISTINSGKTVKLSLTDDNGLYNYSNASSYYKYAWTKSSSILPSNNDYMDIFTSKWNYEVSFSVVVPFVSKVSTYYLWVYNTGQDKAGNVATYSGKTPYSIGIDASDYLIYEYQIIPAGIDSIFISATIDGGKITFKSSEKNNLKNYYENGKIVYFFGKPDIYDNNLDNAFNSYGVTIDLSTSDFFTENLSTPQGLIGDITLYIKLMPNDENNQLPTLYFKNNDPIKIENDTNEIINFNLIEEFYAKKDCNSFTLGVSNLLSYSQRIKSDYFTFAIIIFISSIIAMEIVIIKKRKNKGIYRI